MFLALRCKNILFFCLFLSFYLFNLNYTTISYLKCHKNSYIFRLFRFMCSFFSLNNSPKALFTYNPKKLLCSSGSLPIHSGYYTYRYHTCFFKNILFYLFSKKQTFLTNFYRFSTMFHVKHCINGIFLPYSRIICINIPNSFPILVYFG